MTTVIANGISYDIQVVNGVLQYKESSATAWISHTQATAVQAANWVAPWVMMQLADGTYRSTRLDSFEIYNTVQSWDFDGTVTNVTPVPIVLDGSTGSGGGSTPPASGPLHTIASPATMSNYPIHDLAPGVLPTDAVNVSQLTAAQASLNIAINAGDQANANDIAATNMRIDNLPGGITMAQVENAVNTGIAAAVLTEALDDAQVQALTDAAIQGLQNIDATTINRLTTAESAIAGLDTRADDLEAADAAQLLVNTAQAATNGVQTIVNQNVSNAIGNVVASVATEAQINATQNTQLSQQAASIGSIQAQLAKLRFSVSGGVCTAAVNSTTAQCVPTGLAGDLRSYTVTLPATHAYCKPEVYFMAGNSLKLVQVGEAMSADGLTCNLCFKDADAVIVIG